MLMGRGGGDAYLLLFFCYYISKRAHRATTMYPPTPIFFCVINFMILQSLISAKTNLISNFSPYRAYPKFAPIY